MRVQESFRERLARALYQGIGIVTIPFLIGYLLWRSVRQPAYRRHWVDRFWGRSARTDRPFQSHDAPRVLWVHAVSVGETRAAAPLIFQWLERHSSHCIVLTYTTPTGAETGQQLFAKYLEGSSDPLRRGRLVQCTLPYDFSWACARFLRWARPSLGVLMETELWPNLLAQSDALTVPVVLVNARLSPRSARRLKKWRWLSRPAVMRLAGIAAQNESDLSGFRQVLSDPSSVGRASPPRLEVVGNLKFDSAVSAEMTSLGETWRLLLGLTPIWLAASTREDEERDLLTAWRAHADRRGVLVIVPRHPQRFDRVARFIEEAGFRCFRRSDFSGSSAAQEDLSSCVILGDSLGEMAAYMAMADLVLMGGSLVPLGGQNPIEASAAGKPVFFGPHMFNFAQIARDLLHSGAGTEVDSYQGWFRAGSSLMDDARGLADRADLAQAFAAQHRGATMRTIDFMESVSAAAR
jgi:3-deoxy-D-manno-octulosonic-acid transferase